MADSTSVATICRRVVPTQPPEAIEQVQRGNFKQTALATYADRVALVVQLGENVTETVTEAVLLAAVERRTSVPVPKLLDYGCLGGRGYLVTEYVPGDDLHERFVELESARQQRIAHRFGRILAQLHEAFPFESAGPVSVDDDGQLVAAGRTVAADFSIAVETWLEDLPAAFDDLQPALESALAVPGETGSPRLFPWDLRPGNAIYSDGRIAAILDWGGPRAADPALSFAKTEHLVCRWYGIDPAPLESAFHAGYESIRDVPEIPRPYRIAAVVSAAVDSTGVVTRPHYPEQTGTAAVAIHRGWLAELLDDEIE